MVICVAGMHRSGSSLVARLLNLSGVYLGRDEDLLPGNPTNPDGHWEHERIVELNDELLAEFGGGWDYPPDLSGLSDRARVDHIERAARAVLQQFDGHACWGWKDPRNSLTLPFWRRLIGPLRVVVCVRNPLEVAMSLRRRGASSLALGLSLWTAYNESILRVTRPDERIVTHYQNYLIDPAAEIARLAARLGLPLTPDELARVSATVRHESRHNYFTSEDLQRANVSSRVMSAYRRLSEEAGVVDGTQDGDSLAEPHFNDLAGRFAYPALKDHLVRRVG